MMIDKWVVGLIYIYLFLIKGKCLNKGAALGVIIYDLRHAGLMCMIIDVILDYELWSILIYKPH